jgi:hypothetical protein
MTVLLSLKIGDDRLVILVPIVNVGAKLVSYVTVLGSLSNIAYVVIGRDVLLEKTSL